MEVDTIKSVQTLPAKPKASYPVLQSLFRLVEQCYPSSVRLGSGASSMNKFSSMEVCVITLKNKAFIQRTSIQLALPLPP
jgi:hypothetical protein